MIIRQLNSISLRCNNFGQVVSCGAGRQTIFEVRGAGPRNLTGFRLAKDIAVAAFIGGPIVKGNF